MRKSHCCIKEEIMKEVGVYVQDDKQNRKCVCVIFTYFILENQTFALIHADI